ncbi:neuromedin-U receptor 1-like [Amphiura filiformis]|uniref:neuromedin-U receptor 1-like n=1 Tax=Amphiura filiformis TaxID=82378 RepID=UPI003B21C7FF
MKWQYSAGDTLIIGIGVPIVFSVGLCGNFAFLFVIARIKRMRTITNFYLGNIAIADMIFLTTASGFYLSSFAKSSLIEDTIFESSIGCTLNFLPCMTGYFGSMILVTLVTLERFYAICFPLQHRSINGKGRTVKLVIISWLISLAFGAATVTGYGHHITYCFVWPETEEFHSIPTIKNACTGFNNFFWLLSTATETLPFLLTLCANTIMYVFIIKALGRRSVTKAEATQETQMKRVRNQVAFMLIINGSLFFLCQAPYRIVAIENFVVEITGDKFLSKSLHDTLLALGRTLFFINSAINTYVYNAVSPFYREAFKEAFCCVFVGKEAKAVSRTTTISN